MRSGLTFSVFTSSMKYFVDCGMQFGQGLKRLDAIHHMLQKEEWKVFSFEPNPHIHVEDTLADVTNITKIRKAVWTTNTTLTFECRGKASIDDRRKYGEERFQGGGSGIVNALSIPLPPRVETTVVDVEAVDLAEFLQSLVGELVVLKLDVEGAEFAIVPHLVAKGVKVDYMYIELHGHTQQEQEELLRQCSVVAHHVVRWD